MTLLVGALLLLPARNLGSSGVDVCRRKEYSDRSLELVRLAARCFSAPSEVTKSEVCNLCEDFDASKFEKIDFDASRPCLGGVVFGDGGSSGMAVSRGEVGDAGC